MPISTPSQITVPFATSGLKNPIPATANPVTGNAGYDAGFPATNMTPKEAGGIPPFGQDFNGILFDITTAIQYLEAGMQFPYSSSFATAVGGYPLGAIVTRTDGTGFWRNTAPNNTTNPETFGAGWQPEGSGITTVAMSNANVTLTALQAAKSVVIITGTLTANLNLVMPTYQRQWLIVNRATGAFSVTCKTVSGGGPVIANGTSQPVYGDGTYIIAVASVPTGTTTTQGIARFGTPAEQTAGLLATVMANPAGVLALVTAMFPKRSFSSTADFIRIPDQPGGLLIQWAKGSLVSLGASGTTTQVIPFPTPFGSAPFVMAGTFRASGSQGTPTASETAGSTTASQTTITMVNGANGTAANFAPIAIAIGN